MPARRRACGNAWRKVLRFAAAQQECRATPAGHYPAALRTRYAVPALVKASSASESVGNIRKTCSTLVISKTLSTRLFTPVSATRRPALAHEVQALTSDPSPEESR